MRVRKLALGVQPSCSDSTFEIAIVRPLKREGDDSHFAGAQRALLQVGGARRWHVPQAARERASLRYRKRSGDWPCAQSGIQFKNQARSDGSVFFAGVRMSGASCAKIHDEQAVMIPTHRKVA